MTDFLLIVLALGSVAVLLLIAVIDLQTRATDYIRNDPRIETEPE